MTVRSFFEYMGEQREAVKKHKWYLSEKAKRDVGWEFALLDFLEKGYAAKFSEDYMKNHNLTAFDTEVTSVLSGDSCIILELRAIAHNHESGRESVLEDVKLTYCFGRKENCPNRKISEGIAFCERK